MKKLCILLLVAFLILPVSTRAEGSKILIKNGTIVPVTGETIENGEIFIDNGKIAAIGKGLSVPDGTEIIDATGMYVYPGFIDAFSSVGLVEIGSIASTVDMREMGKENPELKATWGINPASVHFGTSRLTGVTTALVSPRGGTFPGFTAIVKMDGWTIDEMLLKEVATSQINFPITPRSTRETRMVKREEAKLDVTAKLIEKISDYLNETREYLKKKEAAEKNKSLTAPDYNPKYEALAPVLTGKIPVILSVEKASDIEHAIRFLKEQKLNGILRGCAQGWLVIDKIKEAGLPVIVDDLYSDPVEPEDGYDAPFRNVKEMSDAGITICFSTGSAIMGKDLPYHAARAVAFGMNRDEAIRALTINPAKILGISDRVGSLEVGKDADLIISTGDPLDFRTEVKRMFINGKEVNLKDNWWDKLYEKWNSRPLPEGK